MINGIFSRQTQLFTGGPVEGFLQKFHPASRLIVLLILLLGISLGANVAVLAGFFAVAMIAAVISYLNVKSIYRLILFPLVILAIPSWLVATFFYDLRPAAGAVFLLRTLASVTTAAVMLHSIGLRRITEALAWFRLPVELRLAWTMMVSQVAVFSELVSDMALARSARQVKPQRGGAIRRQIGGQAGILFARTYQRGNQLSLAMESRRIVDDHGRSRLLVGRADGWGGGDFVLVAVAVGLAVMGVLM